MTLQQETVAQWIADARPLILEHWRELGLDLDLKIDPDIDKMQIMEKIGLFSIYTARHNGKLLGYILAVTSTHLHYRTSPLMFIVDAYYVVPEYRKGVGVKLFKFMEAEAKMRGAIKLYASCKVHKDHSDFFKGLGYRLSDYAFIKRI